MKVVFALLACLFFTSAAFAMPEAREIAGTVTDANSRYVTGIRVKLINQDTRKTYQTKTNKSGFYSFRNLPFGQYTLRFEGKKEFAVKTIEKLELGMNGGLMYNVSLEPKRRAAKTAWMPQRLKNTRLNPLTYEQTAKIQK